MKGTNMTTTQEPTNVIAKGTNGWIYEFKRAGKNLRFIRYPEGEREWHGSPDTIFLEFCEPFEIPVRVRQALFSFKTAGERVIKAATALAVQP